MIEINDSAIGLTYIPKAHIASIRPSTLEGDLGWNYSIDIKLNTGARLTSVYKTRKQRNKALKEMIC